MLPFDHRPIGDGSYLERGYPNKAKVNVTFKNYYEDCIGLKAVIIKMKTPGTCSLANWQKVLAQVNRAVVFLDNVCAELLHWQGGLLKLIKAGAVGVKEFSSFESGAQDQKKAVFIISSVLEGVAKEILQDIIRASKFQYVVLITTHSVAVHSYSRHGSLEEDGEFNRQVEERLMEWMGNMNYTAEVMHIPLFTLSPDNSVFITPGYAGLFPLLDSDLHQLELLYSNRKSKIEDRDFDTLKNLDVASLPKELRILYKCFVGNLDSLLLDLGVKEDIYSLGYTSALLAAELEALPTSRNRRKSLSNRASLVLIDRTLDLASTSTHATEAFLDKLVQVLPRLQGHVTDISVDMASLCKVHSETGSSMVMPGTLASQTDTQFHLHSLVTGKQKDCLMDVNRKLVEAATQCNLPVSLKGRPTKVTAEQLDSTLQLFKGKYEEISSNLDAVQVAMAAALTLKHPRMQHCDELISVEKGLLQCVADPDGPNALSQILQMIERKEADTAKRLYSLDDILTVLVYLYSLAGPDLLDSSDEENAVQTALADRILEEKAELPSLTKSIVGDVVGDRSVLLDILEDLWSRLAAVANARQHLSQFSSVLDPGSAVSPASHNSLCKQVVEAIFDLEKREITDIEFKSSGLKDMLKSGFGLFRSVAKPRPSDHPLLILFIVGGVMATEVKQIQDVVNFHKPATEVIIGSTQLLSPVDTVRAVLSQNNVSPGLVTEAGILFRSVAKPRPSDHPLLILFIVGGVTATEVKQIQDVVNLHKPATEVIIGSTQLLSPIDTVRAVLSQNNVSPVLVTEAGV